MSEAPKITMEIVDADVSQRDINYIAACEASSARLSVPHLSLVLRSVEADERIAVALESIASYMERKS